MHITLTANISHIELHDYVSIMHTICMYLVTIIHVEYGDI